MKLKAVDGRDLEAEVSVLVSVNGAPALSELGQSFAGSSHQVDETLTLTNEVSSWFVNAEDGDTLVYTGTSKNSNIASIGATEDVLTNEDIDITGVTLGRSTTITVTATENAGLRQSASVEFTVSVTGVTAG